MIRPMHLQLVVCTSLLIGCATNNRPDYGFVKLTYDLDIDENPSNIRVVDANPKGIFEKAAIKAIQDKKMNLAPKGTKLPAKDLELAIDFQLNDLESTKK